MGEHTAIEWADHTANFWEGCAKVAEGCKFCYAESYEKRMGRDIWGKTKPRKWTKGGPALVRKLNKKAKAAGRVDTVFVNDLADFFEEHEGVVDDHEGQRLINCPVCGIEPYRQNEPPLPDGCEDRWLTISDLRADAFRLFDECQNLIFMLLTKRPENIRRMWPENSLHRAAELWGKPGRGNAKVVRPNCWLGCSIATQADADRNIPELLKCRDLSPVLFVSAEPLIEAVDLTQWFWRQLSERDVFGEEGSDEPCDVEESGDINWLIVGGESGPGARPCNVSWIRSLVEQCKAAEVACFVKQLGSKSISRVVEHDGKSVTLYSDYDHKKGGDPSEWPEDLRVREFPRRQP